MTTIPTADATVPATLREVAIQAAVQQAGEASILSHCHGYHRLHVYRDGTVDWSEYPDELSDTIDRQAGEFAPIPSAAHVGTGSIDCNCGDCGCGEWPSHTAAGKAALHNDGCYDMDREIIQSVRQIPAGYFADEQ